MDIKGKEFIKEIIEATRGLETKMMYVRDFNGVPEVISSTEDSRVNMFIKSKGSIDGMTKEFGLSNLSILQGIVKLEDYLKEDSTLKLIEKNDIVGGIEYKDGNKKIKYQAPDIQMNQFKKLKTLTNYHDRTIPWTVVMNDISSDVIKQFNQMSTILAGVTKNFHIKNVDGDLKFCIGDETNSNHSADIIVDTNISGTIDTPIYYDAKSFINVLNKIKDKKCRISIYDRGSIELFMENDSFEYKYIFLGSQQEN